MNIEKAKRILESAGYLLKEDAFRNNTDMSDIYAIIEAHDWSPKLVAEEIIKHYYEPITVEQIDNDNYKDYIGRYVNVTGNVGLEGLNLTKLPIRFGTVGGFFFCEDNKLTSLDGAPEKVGGYFDCNHNNLTSLKGAPKEVGGDFTCWGNKVEFTEDDVSEVSNVKGKIRV